MCSFINRSLGLMSHVTRIVSVLFIEIVASTCIYILLTYHYYIHCDSYRVQSAVVLIYTCTTLNGIYDSTELGFYFRVKSACILFVLYKRHALNSWHTTLK